jgi:hypothetical protein
MLFTSGPDPGEGLLDPNVAGAVDPVNRAALLSRYRDRRGGFEYSLPLTGTRQIAPEGGEQRRDCTPVPLTGRLASLGDLYAAYFAVHGCQGHPSEGFYGDKLVYMNDEGEYQQGGFAWRCSISEGLQLLPEAGRFTSLCLSENMASPGLNLLLENQTKQLSVEAYTQGYVAAQFGSAIKMPDGSYVIGWLSRGTTDRPKVPEKAAPDIALMHLAPDYSVVSDKVWLTDTLDVAENNLHLAPYGPDRVLVIWDAVDVLERHGETGFGLYTGTRARLFDTAGLPVGDEQALPAPPNGGDDISVHANGDLGWAFVPDPSRSYEKTLEIDTQGVPLGIPIRRELAIARLSYCP